MKKLILFQIAIVLLTACVGGKQNQNEDSDNIKWNENDLCAIISLGYGNDFSTFAETDRFKEFCKQFPSLKNMTAFTVEAEGDEIYYIIPRYSDASFIVNEYNFDIETLVETMGKELYRGVGEPILIRCNISDIHPNTAITVTRNDKSVTFSPISGFGEMEGVQLVSLIETYPNVTEPLLTTEYEYAGIRATIEAGRVFLYFNLEELRVTDFYEVPYPLEEGAYPVEGMSGGVYKGVFIGNVGQEIYPVLACLLEDGGVEIMDIYKAIHNHDFRSSERLHGLENIATVVNEMVSYSDEGGGYNALFAVTAEGNKIEIHFNPMSGEWVYQFAGEHGEERYILSLTNDWKISFIGGFTDSEAVFAYLGTCWMVKESDKNERTTVEFGYKLREADRSEMTGSAPDPKVTTGTFRMRQLEYDLLDGVGITCFEGLKFHSGEFKNEAKFTNKLR